MEKKNIELSASEYRKLERDLKKLRALEAGGVDNWEWYGESLTDWFKENDEDELVDRMSDELVDFINDAAIEAEVDYPAGRECGVNVNIPPSSYDAEKFIRFVIDEFKKIGDDR